MYEVPVASSLMNYVFTWEASCIPPKQTAQRIIAKANTDIWSQLILLCQGTD